MCGAEFSRARLFLLDSEKIFRKNDKKGAARHGQPRCFLRSLRFFVFFPDLAFLCDFLLFFLRKARSAIFSHYEADLVYLRSDEEDYHTEVYPEHEENDRRQASVNVRCVRKVDDIQRIEIRIQHPARCRDERAGYLTAVSGGGFVICRSVFST